MPYVCVLLKQQGVSEQSNDDSKLELNRTERRAMQFDQASVGKQANVFVMVNVFPIA